MSASSSDSEYKVRGRKPAFSSSQTPRGRATRRSPDKQPSTGRPNGSSASVTNGGTSSRDTQEDSGAGEVDDSGEPSSRSATARSPELGLSPKVDDVRHASSSLSEHSSKSPTPPTAPPLPQSLSRSRQQIAVERQAASTSTSPIVTDDDDEKPKKRGFGSKKRPAVSSSDESDTTQVDAPTPKPRKVGRPRALPKPTPSRPTSGEDVDPVENGAANKSAEEEGSNGSESEQDLPLRLAAQPKPARGRGRPRGKRTFPSSRAVPSTSRVAATSTSKSKPNSASASESNGAMGGGVRATRATVTLPAGYIEGVKSTRMTKARSESVPAVVEPEVVEVKGKQPVKGKGKGKEKEKREEEEREEEKPEEKPSEPERTTFCASSSLDLSEK